MSLDALITGCAQATGQGSGRRLAPVVSCNCAGCDMYVQTLFLLFGVPMYAVFEALRRTALCQVIFKMGVHVTGVSFLVPILQYCLRGVYFVFLLCTYE